MAPMRERDASACISGHQAFALAPMRETETLPRVSCISRHQAFAVALVREKDVSACLSRHQAFALAPMRETETLPRGPHERDRDASACISGHQAFALPPVSCSPTEMAVADNPLSMRRTLSVEVPFVAAFFTKSESCKAAAMSAAPYARVNAESLTFDMNTIGCRAATTGSTAIANCLHIQGESLAPPYTHLYLLAAWVQTFYSGLNEPWMFFPTSHWCLSRPHQSP